ncbi:MAG: class III extradiol ring-cleavage dioxygenase [Azospirillaceae bacterium]
MTARPAMPPDTAAPALFVSHGSPMLAIEDCPARRFLADYGAGLPAPSAIIVASAHWETAAPTLSTAPRPATIHDFGGFPDALYALDYPAPGAPGVAVAAARRLRAAGLTADTDDGRGLDHGAWVPLRLMIPDADIPVVSLSVQPMAGPAHHLAVGRALAPLRDEGVAILGSGALTHDLRTLFGTRPELDAAPPSWVTDFADWVAEAVAAGRIDDLVHYRCRAPHAARNHPTEEHVLPLFVALGAGGPGAAGARVHSSTTYGLLAMDAFAFG